MVACASDPQMLAWEARLERVERQAEGGQSEAALRGFTRLQATALNPLDPQLLTLRKAWTHARAGRHTRAVELYSVVAQNGLRRMDRARARYEIARIMESQGRHGAAVAVYRHLALVYPDLMPGLRGLAHAERLMRGRGRRGVDAHLAWLRQHYRRMKSTELGDNFIFAAAHEARRRALSSQRPGRRHWQQLAESLYLRIHSDHHRAGLWLQAMWELSFLYHRQERWRQEATIIERIWRTREGGGLFGDTGHAYHTAGLWRLARLHQKRLGQPAEAARILERFLGVYRTSRLRDDARFFQGCTWLQAGQPQRAERAWALIAKEYEASKYLRRVAAARANPSSAVCDLPIREEVE